MSLSILSIVPFWASQSALNSLVPSTNVWLDVPADNSQMPYVIITQISQKPEWMTNGSYVSRMQFQLTVYAATLAQVDQIVSAILTAFKWANVSGNGFGCRLENVIPKGEAAGAYSCAVTYTMFETLS